MQSGASSERSLASPLIPIVLWFVDVVGSGRKAGMIDKAFATIVIFFGFIPVGSVCPPRCRLVLVEIEIVLIK